MKINRPFFYLLLFIGGFAILVGFDYSKSGSFDWFDNFMQAAFVTIFYIFFMIKSLKKSSDKKTS